MAEEKEPDMSVSIRLPISVEDAVVAYGKSRGMARSPAGCELIEKALKAEESGADIDELRAEVRKLREDLAFLFKTLVLTFTETGRDEVERIVDQHLRAEE